jgi:hypothetical protein
MKYIFIASALLLAACGSPDDAGKAREEGAFDDLTETIDRAEAVEQKVLEHKDRLDEALEEMDRPADEPKP